MKSIGSADLASMVDLSCVQAHHDLAEIAAMADFALEQGIWAVFALPAHAEYLKSLIAGSPVRLGGAVGFPSGSTTTEIKVAEAAQLLDFGADELDMVINLTWLRSGERAKALRDVRAVVEAAGSVPVKLILEVAYLDERMIREGCEIGVEAGVEFIKSGTGWASLPTTLEQVRLMAKAVGGRCKLKAAGGVRDLTTLLAMRELGVSRFGIGTKTARNIFAEAGGDRGR